MLQPTLWISTKLDVTDLKNTKLQCASPAERVFILERYGTSKSSAAVREVLAMLILTRKYRIRKL
jgi:hypothetical protein